MSDPHPQKPEMSEKERDKKMTRAMFIMFAIELPGLIGFWLIRMFLHDGEVALMVLVMCLAVGTSYFVYQTQKLRPKDKSRAR